MDPSDVMVPADVPDELIDTYVENYSTPPHGPDEPLCVRPEDRTPQRRFLRRHPTQLQRPWYTCSKSVTLVRRRYAGVLAGQLGLIAQYVEMHLTFVSGQAELKRTS